MKKVLLINRCEQEIGVPLKQVRKFSFSKFCQVSFLSPQMLGWNVGGVYLVACAFQAVILVCAAYTLFFLKLVLISFCPIALVHRSLLLRINQCSSSLIFQFIQLSSPKLQETGVETARAKCCDHLILSVQTLLKFS